MQIILVDDHHLFGQSLYSLLVQMKDVQKISVFKRGADVLVYLKTNKADIVLSDLQMPEMNGIELTAKIHEDFPEIKV